MLIFQAFRFCSLNFQKIYFDRPVKILESSRSIEVDVECVKIVAMTKLITFVFSLGIN